MTLNARVLVLTHGFLHDLPDVPPADVALDLRRLLTDPDRSLPETLRDETGQHDEVRRFVYATRGATVIVDQTARLVVELSLLLPRVVVHVGCAGGKHRAVAIGDGLAIALEQLGISTEVRHLHKDLDPVVRSHQNV